MKETRGVQGKYAAYLHVKSRYNYVNYVKFVQVGKDSENAVSYLLSSRLLYLLEPLQPPHAHIRRGRHQQTHPLSPQLLIMSCIHDVS